MTRIIIDTETTGLNPLQDEVLQLAIIDADTGETLLNHHYGTTQLREWPAAEAVNHISPADVEGLPPLSDPDEQTRAAEIIAGADWVGGWNTDFDLSMLWAYQIAPRDDAKIFDVMKYEANYCGRIIPARDGRGYEVKWRKLVDAAKFWGYIPFSGDFHDALTDCQATRAVWREIQIWHNSVWNKNNRFKYIEARDYLRDIMSACSKMQAELLDMMQEPDDAQSDKDITARLCDLSKDLWFSAILLGVSAEGMTQAEKGEALREALKGKYGCFGVV